MMMINTNNFNLTAKQSNNKASATYYKIRAAYQRTTPRNESCGSTQGGGCTTGGLPTYEGCCKDGKRYDGGTALSTRFRWRNNRTGQSVHAGNT